MKISSDKQQQRSYNKDMKIFYMGRIRKRRYTFQLTDWTKRAYDKRGVKYEIVPGETIDEAVDSDRTGARCTWQKLFWHEPDDELYQDAKSR